MVPSELFLWFHFCMGGKKVPGWAPVNCFQTAGACGACHQHRTHKILRMWGQKELVGFFIFSFFPFSGAAKDHWAAGLWGCGVPEKSPDPQRPTSRPAALSCRRCLGETHHSSLGLTLTTLLINMYSYASGMCCKASSFTQVSLINNFNPSYI